MKAPNHRASFWYLVFFFVGCNAPGAEPAIEYAKIFLEDQVPTWSLKVSTEDWARLVANPGEYATAELRVPESGIQLARVGLRAMGDPGSSKPSLRFDFNRFEPGQTYLGLKKLNLRNNARDPSAVREVVGLQLMRDSEIPAPRASLVWVTLNGEALGLYSLVEQVDKAFLWDRFRDNQGNLYKFELGADLVYQGEKSEAYPDQVYERKTNESDLDRSDLIGFIRVLNQTPQSELAQKLAEQFDCDGFLKLLAVNTWLANLRSYPGSGDNLYLYRDGRGRFRAIPWDLNQSFANYHGKYCGLSTDAQLRLDPDHPTCGAQRPLVDRLLDLEPYRHFYHDALRGLVDGPLKPERVRQVIERWRARAGNWPTQDPHKEFTNEQIQHALDQDIPETGVNRTPGLWRFLEIRDPILRESLRPK